MRIALTNFTGGEIAPSLSARYDLGRYKNSVQCMENFLPNVHGNVERRPGTYFIANLGSSWEDEAVLYPFSFNVEPEHNFIIVITHQKLRIANTASGLMYNSTISSPWAWSDLTDISFAQVGDIVYFAHKNYPLRKLIRIGNPPYYNWELHQVVLNSSLPAPTNVTAQFWGSVTEYGYTLNYKVVAVDEHGRQSLASQAAWVGAKHPSDWITGEHANVTWSPVNGAVEYNIYREEAGYFGYVGSSKAGFFTDNNYEANIADTPRENWNPFANGNNPGIVAFHEQRMILASTAWSPQAFYMSRVGDFENFRKSRPLQDDDPVEYHIASGSIDNITWAASFGDLLLGTSGSEFKVSGNGAPITSSNVNISAQSYWGSDNLPPLIIGNSILHVQRHGARVRDLFYSLEKDGYAGNDLSIMAPHLFEGHSLRQWAFQQSPSSSLWIVREDGVLLALTYMKEHDIWGWSRHVTDGQVRSVAVVSGKDNDDVYIMVKRNLAGKYDFTLERIAPRWQEDQSVYNAFFVDCGISKYFETPTTKITGIGYLENKVVSVLADGSPIEGLVVKGGSITLPYAATWIHVGLPYQSVLSPLPIEGDLQNGTTLTQQRAYGQCSIRLQNSIGGKYGVDKDNLYDFPFVPEEWARPVQPFSGDINFTPGGGQSSNTTLWIVQDKPLPFNVQALVMNVDMQGL